MAMELFFWLPVTLIQPQSSLREARGSNNKLAGSLHTWGFTRHKENASAAFKE